MDDGDPKTGPVEVSRALTDAMERAGVHPAYVHAVRRCGFVYTQENAASMPEGHVARWDAAVEEWFALHPDDAENPQRYGPGPGPQDR